MSIQSALDHIETKLRVLVELPDHELRWLLTEIETHLPRHLTDEVIMAVIDDVSAGIAALNDNIQKLLDLVGTEGSGQSAAVAELADVNTKLTVVASALVAINAKVGAVLNPPAADPAPDAAPADPAPADPAPSVLA